MKNKTVFRVIVVLLLFISYRVGYVSGFSKGRKALRVMVATDTSDSRSSGKTEYEPYFTKQNPIPDRVK